MQKAFFLLAYSLVLGCSDRQTKTDRHPVAIQQEDSLSTSSKSPVWGENLPVSLQLPLKVPCTYFFNYVYPIWYSKDSTWRISTKQGFDLLIVNQQDVARPILYTKSILKSEKPHIDSLVLFDHFCYNGIDSHYLPWLEINEDLKVSWIDTAYYYAQNKDDPATPALELGTDTVITYANYRIDKNGKFEKIRSGHR